MHDVYTVAIVFNQRGYRFVQYACKQAQVLLSMQKQVLVISPDFMQINQYLHKHCKPFESKFNCLSLLSQPSSGETPSKIASLTSLYKLKIQMKQYGITHQTKVDLVMFCPADGWFNPTLPNTFLDKFFNIKWSALYLNLTDYYNEKLVLNKDPKRGETDYYLAAKNCVGVSLIDRYMVKSVQSRVYKKVVVLPDITWAEPNISGELKQHMVTLANGRTIVGFIRLEKESLKHFLATALYADSEQYYFVFAGNLTSDEVTGEVKAYLNKLLNNDNFLFLNNNFEESRVDEFIHVFDVVFLHTENYHKPHILLTKAALHHKPVIASRLDMTGQLVSTFKTGMVVGNKLAEVLQALQVLRMQQLFNSSFSSEPMKNYAKLQSEEPLRESMEHLMMF